MSERERFNKFIEQVSRIRMSRSSSGRISRGGASSRLRDRAWWARIWCGESG